MLVKLLDFAKGNRDSLIIVSLLIGLYGAYQAFGEGNLRCCDIKAFR
jgi:hypothetical protein